MPQAFAEGPDKGKNGVKQVTRKTKSRFKSSIATVAVLVSLGLATTVPDRGWAQNYAFTSVSVDGNQRIEPATILSYAGIPRGETVSAGQLNGAFQRLEASGLFESVELIPQGNSLLIKVVEYPTINTIAFEGNNRLKDEDLAGIVQSQSRRVFSPRVAEADAQIIAEAFAQQGRTAARVKPRVIRRSDNRVDLVFEVFEGGNAEIERIGFTGNDVFSDYRLRRVVETKQTGLLSALIAKDTFVEDRIAYDRQLLSDFYASRGYVDFRVTGVNAELSEERDSYFVTFGLQEGQQFRFGDISVVSDLPNVDPLVYQNVIKVKPDKVYSPTLVENDIARIERQVIKEGQNFLQIEPRVTRNDRDLTLDIEYVISRAPRVFVERIDIEGNTTTRDDVVRREFDLVEGDPFNPRAIRQAASRIRALGFFSNAEVNAREGSTPDQVIVDVDVEEQPTGSLSLGGSYSGDDGFGVNVGFSERNFLGRAQVLSLSASTTSSDTSYSFSFSEPAFLGRDVGFGVSLSFRETDNEGDTTYDTRVARFRPSLTFPVSENGRLQVRYTAEMSEMTNIDQDDDELGDIIKSEAFRDEIFDSSIGLTYSYDTRRTGLNPNAGFLLEFGGDFGYGLGGEREFSKLSAKGIAQTTLFNEEITLRARLEGGVVDYDGGSRAVDRFNLGSSILRGFSYAGIGPREVDEDNDVDDPLGGNYYAVASVEAEFPLGLPEEYGLRGALFYDIGSVWGLDASNSNVLYEDFSARHVIGFSILWDSAFGPLRLDFTEALVKEEYDDTQGFDLTINSQF